MTQSSARTMPARSGQPRVSGERRGTSAARRRAATTARRRWLILCAVVAVVVAGILANIKPLTHLQDASARLDKATTKVSDLRAQQANLQGQLAKLSEAGYLETLARGQLSYAKPGEDLYIVTGGPDDTSDGNVAVPPVGLGPGLGAALNAGFDSAAPKGAATTGVGRGSTTSTTDTGRPAERPGVLERIISAIRGLF